MGRLGIAQSRRLITVALAGGLVAFALLGVLGGTLAFLVLGTLAIDAGSQVNEVANLVEVMSDRTADYGRANTIFMGVLFVGGAVGSGLGDLAYSRAGWAGACSVGVSLCTVALVIHFSRNRRLRT